MIIILSGKKKTSSSYLERFLFPSFALFCFHKLLQWTPMGHYNQKQESRCCSLKKACVLGHFSRVRLSATPWPAAHRVLLSARFSRQEYCSGSPRPPPGDPALSGIQSESPVPPALQADSLSTEPLGKPKSKACAYLYHHYRLNA